MDSVVSRGEADFHWTSLPKSWDEGPFMGNGELGSMLYHDGTLRLDFNSSLVQDHRRPIINSGIENSRLPIGHFVLDTKGKITSTELRLSLNDAVTRGTFHTDHGSIELETYVHAVSNVLSVRTTCHGEDAGWRFVPEEANSPRQAFGLRTKVAARYEEDYVENPRGRLECMDDRTVWIQPLLAGGGTVTAWKGGILNFDLSIAFDRDSLTRPQVISPDLNSHLSWWHAYYPASSLTIPDKALESFYWRQLYKVACSTRSDRPLIDNNGPWLQPTPWPYATWNLNVQLNYWCMLTSNHADLAESLMTAIHTNRDELVANCEEQYRHDSATLLRTAGTDLHSPAIGPRRDGIVGKQGGLAQGATVSPPEMGNLPWALHNCWLLFRHTMDLHMLGDKLYPMLRRTTNYYLHFVYEDGGVVHIPSTYSPEYGSARDATYNLALLRWSCETLLESVKLLGIDDPLAPRWQHVLDRLVDYPSDSTGWLVGADFPLTESHRHYSHLLQAYPLYLVNLDQGEDAMDMIRRTLDHWQSMPEKLAGYSFTGASSICAALGDGDRALVHLQGLFPFLGHNTMYKEDGPVIETPLSAAQSILDMLLQSWGGVVRPFPAMPSSWGDAAFTTLSAEGGFKVSAKWTGHRTEWIRVYSTAGQPLVVKCDIPSPRIYIDDEIHVEVGPRGLVIPLEQGQTALIK